MIKLLRKLQNKRPTSLYFALIAIECTSIVFAICVLYNFPGYVIAAFAPLAAAFTISVVFVWLAPNLLWRAVYDAYEDDQLNDDVDYCGYEEEI